jgi:hypothetical protein
MSPENPSKTPEAEFPLKTWFEALKEEDRNIIDADIFNGYDAPPLEKTLHTLKDAEQGRYIMRMFKEYAEQRKTKALSPAELKLRAKEIAEYLDKKFEEAIEVV